MPCGNKNFGSCVDLSSDPSRRGTVFQLVICTVDKLLVLLEKQALHVGSQPKRTWNFYILGREVY